MGAGESVEIYKEVGLPRDVVDALRHRGDVGHPRHRPHPHGDGIGGDHHGRAPVLHRRRPVPRPQRLAVQPQQPAPEPRARRHDLRDRERLRGRGRLSHHGDGAGPRPRRGAGGGLDDLDGFFTFVVGTESGFGVLRDPIACKPAVMAETDRYVAFGSEYRALVGLPGIEAARVWEPEPATVYFWDQRHAPEPPRRHHHGPVHARLRSGGDAPARAEPGPARRRRRHQRHRLRGAQPARPARGRGRHRRARHRRGARLRRLLLRRHERRRHRHGARHGRARRRREHDVRHGA